MSTRAALVVALALVLATPAQAALHMTGDVKQRHWNWARAAQLNVPLADNRVAVFDGAPTYLPELHIMFLPFYTNKDGWTAHLEHGLFLHELGHVYDQSNMTPSRRLAFRQVAVVPASCAWRAPHCRVNRWVSGPNYFVDVPPAEMFAEMYAACALGLTQRGYQDAQYGTYGWMPPAGTDASLCALIRSA